MSDDVHYETRSAYTVRGLEARTLAKWESDGWELVDRSDASMLRSKLTFRRAKKSVPRWIWVATGAVAASLLAGVLVGSLIGDRSPSASAAATSPATGVAATEPAASPSVTDSASSAIPTASASPTRTAAPVTRGEVVAAFRKYFAERAAANVMVGRAVTKVTFKHHVVRVTFDPAAAGVSQSTFDELNAFDNLGKFAATPIAFADETGNRLRPAVDAIKTVTPEGKSLGTYSRSDILALNELTE